MAASHAPMRLPDPPAPILAALSDDLLERILIRLPTLTDLGRASTVCVAFHRVISDHSFLRRLRALHPLPLLGIMSASFIPAQPPHPCAKLARAIAAAADFRCHFVPSPDRWHLCDFRDGRALLASVPEGSGGYNPRALVREFAVCDPLYRRYRLLPVIPDDLAALVHEPDMAWFSPFLAPYVDDEGGTSFRVICFARCQTKLIYFIFSSVGGSWHANEFDGLRALTAGSANPAPGRESWLSAGYYAHGYFCWRFPARELPSSNDALLTLMLKLNIHTMEFSLSTQDLSGDCAFVEAGGGKFGLFTLVIVGLGSEDRFFDVTSHEYALLYRVLPRDGNRVEMSWNEPLIHLPLNYSYNIIGVAGGYLLLQGIPPEEEAQNIVYFSLNLKTFQVERFCETRHMIIRAPLYAGFPPSLSPPTI